MPARRVPHRRRPEADVGGSEVWSHPERFANGVSIGAPPDLLAPKGQDWGLPAFHPLEMERDGLAAFRALVVANMLSDRPQLAFNQRGAGWPHIYPRSIDELVRLVELAGLPLDRTTVHVPQDGVYAVVEIDVPGPADGPAVDGDEELTISLPV